MSEQTTNRRISAPKYPPRIRARVYATVSAYMEAELNPRDAIKRLMEAGLKAGTDSGRDLAAILHPVAEKHSIGRMLLDAFSQVSPEEAVLLSALDEAALDHGAVLLKCAAELATEEARFSLASRG